MTDNFQLRGQAKWIHGKNGSVNLQALSGGMDLLVQDTRADEAPSILQGHSSRRMAF